MLNTQLVSVIEQQTELEAEAHKEVIQYQKESLELMHKQGVERAKQHQELIEVLSRHPGYASPAQGAYLPPAPATSAPTHSTTLTPADYLFTNFTK